VVETPDNSPLVGDTLDNRLLVVETLDNRLLVVKSLLDSISQMRIYQICLILVCNYEPGKMVLSLHFQNYIQEIQIYLSNRFQV
jgi:hypothetical protein